MAPVLRDMVLIVECVFLEFTGQCQESVQAHKQSGALSLSHNKSMCASTHMQQQLLNKSQRQFTDIFF